jgi:hypothetical protein
MLRRCSLLALTLGIVLVLGRAASPASAQTPPRVPSPGQMAASPPPSPLNIGHAHIFPSRQASAKFGLTPRTTQLPLQYWDGPVEQTSTTYAIFWLPPGVHYEAAATAASDTNYESLIERYFNDVGNSSLYNMLTQYPDNVNGLPQNASTFGGAYIDTSAYPGGRGTGPNPLLDTDIEQEVLNAISANASKGWTATATHQFFVFTGFGVESCFDASQQGCSDSDYCAYHAWFTDAKSETVLYANMFDVGTDLAGCGAHDSSDTPYTPNGDAAADSEINAVSHEHFETVTDPTPSNYSGSTAWLDTNGYEIADKCVRTYGTVASNGSNVTLNGHPYIVQQEWSDAAAACALSLAANTAASPTKSTVTASPSSVPDDGSTASTVTVTLKDGSGNPVGGKTISLWSPVYFDEGRTPPSATTNSSGVATFPVTDSYPDTNTYTATDTTDANLTLTQMPSVLFTNGTAGPASTGDSYIFVSGTTSPPAGSFSPTLIGVWLRDANGNSLPGKTVTLAGNSGTSSTISPASAVSDVFGLVHFAVADTKAETVTYTATDTTDSPPVAISTYSGGTPATISFVPGPASAAVSTVSASPTSVTANGTTTSTITVTLLDAYGNPISGKSVGLLPEGGHSSVSPSAATTGSAGQATFSVKDATAESVTYLAEDESDGLFLQPTASVSFIGAPASATNSTFAASPSTARADDLDPVTITVTLLDVNKTPTPGKAVSVAGTLAGNTASHAVITPPSATTNANGVASFIARDAIAEPVTFKATDTTDSVPVATTASVSFTPGPVDANASTLAAVPPSVVADNNTPSTVTVTLTDTFGNAVSGKAVTLSGNTGSHSTITTLSGTTNSQGQATFSVKDGVAEDVSYTATDTTDSNLQVVNPIDVLFTAGTANAGTSSVAASPTSLAADGVTATTITVTLKDANGNPVSGDNVSLADGSGHAIISAASDVSDANGVVTFTATDTIPESVTFAATDTDAGVGPFGAAAVTFTPAACGCAIGIQPGATTLKSGASGSVTLQAQAPSAGLGSWEATITYNPSLLSISCTVPNTIPLGACQTDYQSQANTILVSGSAVPGLTGTPTLATLSFTALGANGTSSPLSVTILGMADSTGAVLAGTAGSGTVNINVCAEGDVNCNGTVDATDALCVLRLVASLPNTTACPVPPLNATKIATDGNPNLDATDALCILRHIANLPATSACPAWGSQPAGASRGSGVGGRAPGSTSATGLLGARPAAAAASARLSLQPAEVGAGAGRRTTVMLQAESGSSALGAWTVDIAYDPTAVSVVSCTPAAGSLCNTSFAPGIVRIAGASASGLGGTQTLATLTVARKGGNASSALHVRAATLADVEGGELAP